MSELNERYFNKHGHGFGSVCHDDSLHALKTLTIEQIDALVQMALSGDIQEIGLCEDLLGSWANDSVMDEEQEFRTQFAAAIVYLSGRLAEDIPYLQ
jgi:hypothetical protein